MDCHPPKLAVMWPMWQVRNCRSDLSAMDDGLVVHQHPDGRFELEHQPMFRFVSRGQNGHLACLLRIASQLERNYRLVVVDQHRFFRDLIDLARTRKSQSARDDIDWARQVLDERAPFQITDHLFDAPTEYMLGRAMLGGRERRTQKRRNERAGLNMMGGVVTPRTEQLWHSLRHQWCSPRLQQGGHRAWIKWCLSNRPPIPRSDAS